MEVNINRFQKRKGEFSLFKLKLKQLVQGISLGFLLAACTALPANAADVKLIINDENVTGDQPAVIVDQRTYVPFRIISEKLGYDVSWIAETKQVVITTVKGQNHSVPERARDEKGVQIVIDDSILNIPPDFGQAFIAKETNRTMIPLRAVGEALGCEVDWVESTKEVIVNNKPAYIPNPNDMPEEEEEDLDDVSVNQPADPVIAKLAQYQTNIKLLDGSTINTKDLLSCDPDDFSEQQLEEFRKMDRLLEKYPTAITLPNGKVLEIADITIEGKAIVDAEQLTDWLYSEMSKRGIDSSNVPDNLAELYLEIGEEYGIRGDIAFAQAAKETGYFNFTGHVQPWQNNYCGLWAVGAPNTGSEPLNGADAEMVWFEEGVHGAIFAAPEIGVEAHIQHLYAYATDKPLPKGKTLYDPRFIYVKRGTASTWVGLNAKWAVPGTTYGHSIIYDYWKKAF